MNRNLYIKYGVIGGVATVALLLLFYAIGKEWMLHPAVQWSSLSVYAAFMYAAGRQAVAQLGNPESGATIPVLRATFAVFLIINAIYYVFYYILHQADPTLAVYQKEQYLEVIRRFTPPEKLETELERITQADFSATPGKLLMGYAQGAIGGFVLAFLTAFLASRGREIKGGSL